MTHNVTASNIWTTVARSSQSAALNRQIKGDFEATVCFVYICFLYRFVRFSACRLLQTTSQDHAGHHLLMSARTSILSFPTTTCVGTITNTGTAIITTITSTTHCVWITQYLVCYLVIWSSLSRDVLLLRKNGLFWNYPVITFKMVLQSQVFNHQKHVDVCGKFPKGMTDTRRDLRCLNLRGVLLFI